MDVKETKEMCVFVARLANSADGALADGKISLGDAAQLLSPFMAAGPAFSGAGTIPSELGDLDPAEAEELKQAVAAELDLRNDAAEGVAEEVIGAALQLGAALAAVKKAKAAS